MTLNRQNIAIKKTANAWINDTLSTLKKMNIVNERPLVKNVDRDDYQTSFNQLQLQVNKNIRSLKLQELISCFYYIKEEQEGWWLTKQKEEPLTAYLYESLKKQILLDLACREQGFTFEEYLVASQQIKDKENWEQSQTIVTSVQESIERIPRFIQAKDNALKKLQAVMKTSDYLLPLLKDLDLPEPERSKACERKLRELEYRIRQDGKNRVFYQQALDLLQDYIEIANLNIIDLPKAGQGLDLYGAFSELYRGLTNDISLLPLDDVKKTLDDINKSDIGSVSEYIKNRDKYKLTPSALLKLPSRQMFTVEVQRERIKLEIAKILGSSKSDTLMQETQYYDKTGLLFTGGDIESLKRKRVAESSGEDDIERFINRALHKKDITDFIRNQVVELLNAQKQTQILKLNAPDEEIGKISSKKEIRKELKETDILLEDAKELLKIHTQKLDQLTTYLPVVRLDMGLGIININTKNIGLLDKAKQDQFIDEAYRRRDKQLADLKLSGGVTFYITADNFHGADQDTQKLVKDVLIHSKRLEKMLNNPVLFNENGKQYRYPGVKHQDTVVTDINIQGENITLTFNKAFDARKLDKRIGAINSTANSITISKNNLFKINAMLLNDQFDAATEYLHTADLKRLKVSYDSGYRTPTINIIKAYLDADKNPAIKFIVEGKHGPLDVKSGGTTSYLFDKPIKVMKNAMGELNRVLQSAKNKKDSLGFIMHAKRNLQFAIQKDLQLLIERYVTSHNPKEITDQMTRAFNAAIKLNRIDEFNDVVMHFINNKFIETKEFNDYLERTIGFAELVTDDGMFLLQSEAMRDDSSEMLNEISDKIIMERYFNDPNDHAKKVLYVQVLQRLQKEAEEKAKNSSANEVKELQNLLYERCKSMDLLIIPNDSNRVKVEQILKIINEKQVKQNSENALLAVIPEVRQKANEKQTEKIIIPGMDNSIDKIRTKDPAMHQLLIRTLRYFGFEIQGELGQQPEQEIEYGLNSPKFNDDDEGFEQLHPFIQVLLSNKIGADEISERIKGVVDRNIGETTKDTLQSFINKALIFNSLLRSDGVESSLSDLREMLSAITVLYPEAPDIKGKYERFEQLLRRMSSGETLLFADIKKSLQEIQAIQDWFQKTKALSHLIADVLGNEIGNVVMAFKIAANKFDTTLFTSLDNFIVKQEPIKDQAHKVIENVPKPAESKDSIEVNQPIASVTIDTGEVKDQSQETLAIRDFLINKHINAFDVLAKAPAPINNPLDIRLQIATFKARLPYDDQREKNIEFIRENIIKNIEEIRILPQEPTEQITKTVKMIAELRDILRNNIHAKGEVEDEVYKSKKALVEDEFNYYTKALTAAQLWRSNNLLQTSLPSVDLSEFVQNPGHPDFETLQEQYGFFDIIRAQLIQLLNNDGKVKTDLTITPSQFIQKHYQTLQRLLGDMDIGKETIRSMSNYWHQEASEFRDKYMAEYNVLYQLLQSSYHKKHREEVKPKYYKLSESQIAEITSNINASMELHDKPYDWERGDSIAFRVFNAENKSKGKKEIPYHYEGEQIITRDKVISENMGWNQVNPERENIRKARGGYENVLNQYAGKGQDCNFFLMKSDEDFSSIYNYTPNYCRFSYVLTTKGLYLLDRDSESQVAHHQILSFPKDNKMFKKLKKSFDVPPILPDEPMCLIRELNKNQLDQIKKELDPIYEKYQNYNINDRDKIKIINKIHTNNPYRDIRAHVKYAGGQDMENFIMKFLRAYKDVGIFDKKSLNAKPLDEAYPDEHMSPDIKLKKCFFKEENDTTPNQFKFYQKFIIPSLTVYHGPGSSPEIITTSARFGENYTITGTAEEPPKRDGLIEINVVGYFSLDEKGDPKVTITEATLVDFTGDLELSEPFKKEATVIHHPDIFIRMSNALHFLACEIYQCEDKTLREQLINLHNTMQADEQYFRTRFHVTKEEDKAEFYTDLNQRMNTRIDEFRGYMQGFNERVEDLGRGANQVNVDEKVKVLTDTLFTSPKLTQILKNMSPEKEEITEKEVLKAPSLIEVSEPLNLQVEGYIVPQQQNSMMFDLNQVKTIEELQILKQAVNEGTTNQPDYGIFVMNLFNATQAWMNRSDNTKDSKMKKAIEELQNTCADMLINIGWINAVQADAALRDVRKILEHKDHVDDIHMDGIQKMRSILRKVDKANKANPNNPEQSFITLLKLQKCALERTHQAWTFWSTSDTFGKGRLPWAQSLYNKMTNPTYFSGIISDNKNIREEGLESRDKAKNRETIDLTEAGGPKNINSPG